MGDSSTDPCNDTKYIVMTALSQEKKLTQEQLDEAMGHLQGCLGCREQFELHDRAKFASQAARRPQPHKTTRRIAPKPAPPLPPTDPYEAT